MKTKQIQQSKEIIIHDFDKGLDHTLKAIDRDLSEKIQNLSKNMIRKWSEIH